MAQLDPTKIKVQSNAVPIWESEVTFQDMMAEQLRHAPWLVLSAALHVVVLLLLWILMPNEEKKKDLNSAQMIDTQQQKVEEPPPPPPPEPVKEETEEEVVLTETVVTESPTEAFDNVVSESTAKESAFDSNQWNSAVGLGGGAGGRYGGRRGGKGKRRSGAWVSPQGVTQPPSV
jgi:hypothetical protein